MVSHLAEKDNLTALPTPSVDPTDDDASPELQAWRAAMDRAELWEDMSFPERLWALYQTPYREWTDHFYEAFLADLYPMTTLWINLKDKYKSLGGNPYDLERHGKACKVAQDARNPERQHAIRISARTLLSTTYDPLTFVVEDILPAGCTLLTGKSKDGKSMMAYDIAVAVASGGKALGHYAVKQGAVWYLALEDGERRAQARLKRMQARTETELSDEAQDQLDFTLWKAPRLGDGLEEDITEWITTTPDARLIVIDILEKIRPLRKANGNAYADDYDPTARLTQLAQEYNVAILIVHHSNKRNADDFRDTASGCMSLIGGADNFWSLNRLPMSEDATLKIIGRDIEEEYDLAMQFKDGYWIALGDARLVVMSGERKAIVEVVRNSPRPLTPKQIAGALDKNGNTTKILLRKLLDSEVLFQPTEGHYALSPLFREETEEQEEAKGQEEDTPPFVREEQPAVPPPLPSDSINRINRINPVNPVNPINPGGQAGGGFTVGLRRVYGENGDRKPSQSVEKETVIDTNGDRVYAVYGVYTPDASTPVIPPTDTNGSNGIHRVADDQPENDKAEICPMCRCTNLLDLGVYRKCALCGWKGTVEEAGESEGSL